MYGLFDPEEFLVQKIDQVNELYLVNTKFWTQWSNYVGIAMSGRSIVQTRPLRIDNDTLR